MKIYYFGELIEDTEDPSVKLAHEKQTFLDFAAVEAETTEKKETNLFDAIDELLDEIDLTRDIFRPFSFQK
jgi:hypothetical protein